MKIIDLKIANGFHRMKAVLGTDAAISRVLGLSRAHIGRILRGMTYYLEDDTWSRIEPIICKYINEDSSNVDPLSVIKKQCFPVISETTAAECNTAFFPISDWAEKYAEDRVSFSEGRPGDFVIRVAGVSMMPWYPPNTLILVRPNTRLKSGDRVITILGDGSVVFKVFAEKGNVFYLFSISANDGANFSFKKKDFTGVRSMYLVIQSTQDEHTMSSAVSEKGIHQSWQEKLKSLQHCE